MQSRLSSFTGPITSTKSIDIVRNGLIAYLDASKLSSYPGTGTTWTDLSGQGAHGTVNGDITWTVGGLASYFNFNSVNNNNYISSSVAQNYLDITIVFYPDFTITNEANIVGIIATSTATTGADKSLRCGGANGAGPWVIGNPEDGNGWSNPSATTFYLNGAANTGNTTINSGWNILGGTRTNTTNGDFAGNWSYYLGSGAYNSVSRGFKGRMAVVCLYNRALSAAEQKQNYGALRSRFGL